MRYDAGSVLGWANPIYARPRRVLSDSVLVQLMPSPGCRLPAKAKGEAQTAASSLP